MEVKKLLILGMLVFLLAGCEKAELESKETTEPTQQKLAEETALRENSESLTHLEKIKSHFGRVYTDQSDAEKWVEEQPQITFELQGDHYQLR